jgi:hypothetical protein
MSKTYKGKRLLNKKDLIILSSENIIKETNNKLDKIIKNEKIFIKLEPNDTKIDPLVMTTFTNKLNIPIYFSKYHFLHNKVLINKTDGSYDKEILLNMNEYQRVPRLLISEKYIPLIYNIDNINDNYDLDNLYKFIDNTNLFDTVIRIINIWIRTFYNKLKFNLKNNINTPLIHIYKSIFKRFNTEHVIDDITVNSFFIKWFNNHNKDEFYFNLTKDLIHFLTK